MTNLIASLLFFIQRQNNRLLLLCSNQKFFHMLISNRIVGHSFIESRIYKVLST